MRWFVLFLAAISAGFLAVPHHWAWGAVAAYSAVVLFGTFLDLSLEWHRP